MAAAGEGCWRGGRVWTAQGLRLRVGAGERRRRGPPVMGSMVITVTLAAVCGRRDEGGGKGPRRPAWLEGP